MVPPDSGDHSTTSLFAMNACFSGGMEDHSTHEKDLPGTGSPARRQRAVITLGAY